MNAAASVRDFFVSSARNTLFVFGGARGGKNEMRMRIDETGKNNTSAEVEPARAVGFAEAFDAAARPNADDTPVANQQRAIANDAQIAKRAATARCRAAQSDQFGASGDEDVFRLRRERKFSHGCQRY